MRKMTSSLCAILVAALMLSIVPGCNSPSSPGVPEQVAPPSFDPPGGSYASSQIVDISTDTQGASIRYTMDGSIPTSAAGTIYGGPIAVALTTTIRAIAYKSGMSDSFVVGATYVISGSAAAATPVIAPSGGPYDCDVGATITCATSGATIWYTTDGSDPATSGTRLSGASPVGPINVAGNGTTMTIKAVAKSSTTSLSAEASETYYIAYPSAATPSFSPQGGIYAKDQNVTISSLTTGATIWYTTDGSDPATSGTRLSGSSPVGPIAAPVSPATTIRAIATAPSFAASAEASAKYKDYYSIGDLGPAGGWVFYDKGSYSDGWRFMEMAPSNQAVDMEWWNGAYTLIETTGTAIGTGAANTAAIVAAQGDGNYAAEVCNSLSVGAYDDWFLPSKDELNEIYVNLKVPGIAALLGTEYWSSSEGINKYGAWFQSFYDGSQTIGYKDRNTYVRAVRRF